jgi:hypothetical protein
VGDETDNNRTEAGAAFLRLVRSAAPPLAIAAAVAYGLLYVAYEQFYRRFGISPADVGIGKTELLSQSIVGPVLLLVLSILVTIIFLTMALAIPTLMDLPSRKRGQHMKASFDRALRTIEGIRLRRLLVVVVALWTIGLTLRLMITSSEFGSDVVRRGERINTNHLDVWLFQLPLLDIRAIPVEVVWHKAASQPAQLRRDWAVFCTWEEQMDHRSSTTSGRAR